MEESVQYTGGDMQSHGTIQTVQNNEVKKSPKTVTEIIPIEDKKSHAIQVLTEKGDMFIIPVIDVRDDEEARLTAEQMNKDSNRTRGSKYLKSTHSLIGRSYQESWKKVKK